MLEATSVTDGALVGSSPRRRMPRVSTCCLVRLRGAARTTLWPRRRRSVTLHIPQEGTLGANSERSRLFATHEEVIVEKVKGPVTSTDVFEGCAAVAKAGSQIRLVRSRCTQVTNQVRPQRGRFRPLRPCRPATPWLERGVSSGAFQSMPAGPCRVFVAVARIQAGHHPISFAQRLDCQ